MWNQALISSHVDFLQLCNNDTSLKAPTGVCGALVALALSTPQFVLGGRPTYVVLHVKVTFWQLQVPRLAVFYAFHAFIVIIMFIIIIVNIICYLQASFIFECAIVFGI